MHLTPAEQRIFALLAHGYTQARMADALHCSPKTVQTHIGHIKQKLHIPHHHDLLLYAAGAYPAAPKKGRGSRMLDVVIDLSHHNTISSFSDIKQSGVLGIIHKATQGTSYVDPTYHARRRQALDEGLWWGAYHFGESGAPYDQVRHFLDTVQPVPTDLLMLDFEAYGAETMAQVEAELFVDEVYLATARWCGLYSGMSFCTETLAGCSATPLARCWLCLARYSTAAPIAPPPWETWTLWQYTDQAVVPGIEGGCDRDQFNGDLAGLQRLWGIQEAIPLVDRV